MARALIDNVINHPLRHFLNLIIANQELGRGESSGWALFDTMVKHPRQAFLEPNHCELGARESQTTF